MNGYTVAALAAAGLWWVARKKRAHRARAACGCKNKATIEAQEKTPGTDCTGTWWQRLHGADMMHQQFPNFSGVSMDPGSVDKVTIAGALSIGWNGDVK